MREKEPIHSDLRQRSYRPDTVLDPWQAPGRQENQRVRNDRKQDRPLPQEYNDRPGSLAALGFAPL